MKGADGYWKLCDYGFVREIEIKNVNTKTTLEIKTVLGTLKYQDPIIINS